MSRDAVLAFMKIAAENEDLQKKILELAKSEGYEYKVGELSDEELEQASGGYLKVDVPMLKNITWYQTSIKTILP